MTRCAAILAVTFTAAHLPALASEAPGTPSAPTFDLGEIRVLGNTVLDTRSIESTVYPFLGPGKSLNDVETARKALESLYHDRGFGTVFVDIPEQTVAEGIVRLRVTEGKLQHSQVTGARFFSQRQVSEQLPAAQVAAVPNLPALQEQLQSLNTQTADRVVVPVLKAGSAPGTVDLSLRVDDHLPFHGSVEVNNRNTADTTSLRAAVAVSYDNLFGRLDSLSLQYQTSPRATREVQVLAASYAARVSDSGARWAFMYLDSKSDVATIGALSVLGTGKLYGTRFIQPLSLTATGSQTLTLGADYKDFIEDIQVDPAVTVTTPIRYVNFSLDYLTAWRDGPRRWSFESAANFGIRGLANEPDQFANKRFKARPNYWYIRSEGSFGMQLPADFSALVRIGGQYSVDSLVSNEQYSVGGLDSVRGYLEAEEFGDYGIRGTLQLNSPTLRLAGDRLHAGAFIFHDLARLSVVDPLPGEPSSVELRSWGAGFEFDLWQHLSGTAVWSMPLVTGSSTQARDSHVIFSMKSSW